ncbi:hypothetical protein GFU48_23170 [Escherichia coli]|nr:hypothetical protein [Escherichia coli]EFC6818722.1 hypothetical protein [Escherichia coli]EFE8095768.1 hypothetical protein [Escherichia coli]EFI7758278.1 hypothetical protein [Escherichia coli]MQR47290.1 hypothetical protein [Escherichia coli]
MRYGGCPQHIPAQTTCNKICYCCGKPFPVFIFRGIVLAHQRISRIFKNNLSPKQNKGAITITGKYAPLVIDSVTSDSEFPIP